MQFWLLVLLSHFSITEKKVSNCGKSGSETKGTLMLMSTAILGAMRAWLAGCAPCWQVWHPAFPCLHLNVHIIIGERLLLYSSDSVGSDYAQVKALRCFYLLKLLLTLLPQCSAPFSIILTLTSPVLVPQNISGWGSYLDSQCTAVSEWFYVSVLDVFFWFNLFFFPMSVSGRGKGRLLPHRW